MKKFLIMLAMIIGFCISSNAQELNNSYMNIVNIGYAYQTDAKNHPHTLSFDLACYGVLISGDMGLNSKGENHYGSCGVSDDIRYNNISLGYGFTLYKNQYDRGNIFLGPTIGMNIEETLYNDSYYDDDVASTNCKFDIGGFLCVRLTGHLNILLKASTKRIGATIGFIY